MKSLTRAVLTPRYRNAAPSYTTSGPVGFRLFGGSNNRTTQLEQFGAVSTLFSVVNLTSQSTSTVTWHLYRKQIDQRRIRGPQPREQERQEVFVHAALELWNKPNPFMPQQEFVETFQQHVDLVGEGWWVVERNDLMRALPLFLWPVRPDRMEPIPGETSFLAGYVYHGPNNEDVPLNLDEVIQLRIPDPRDPYRGIGPVQTLLADLQSVNLSAQWNRNFFLNSAQPGGLIEVEKRLTDDEFNEMRERWNEQHRGVQRAHRVGIIEQGKWVPNAFSQKDMQFVELRNVSRDIIREAYRIHPHMLGQSEDVNLANAQAAEYTFAQWSLVPRLDRIKDTLNNEFLPLFGDTATNLEFDYDSPVPEDEEAANNRLQTQSKAALELVKAGYEPAAVLEAVGLPPMSYVGPPNIPQSSPESVPAGAA